MPLGGSRSHSEFVIFFLNRPKIALKQYDQCVFCLVHTLIKVVGYYDLSVLSMSVIGFQKKFGWGVGGWGELYPSLFWNFVIFVTLQSR